MYIKFMNSKHILLITFLNEIELFLFYIELNGFKYCHVEVTI